MTPGFYRILAGIFEIKPGLPTNAFVEVLCPVPDAHHYLPLEPGPGKLTSAKGEHRATVHQTDFIENKADRPSCLAPPSEVTLLPPQPLRDLQQLLLLLLQSFRVLTSNLVKNAI